MEKNIIKLKKRNKFLFVAMGADGYSSSLSLPPLKKMDSIMTLENSKNFNWNFQIYKGFNHETTPLKSVYNALLSFAEKWKLSENQKNKIIENGNIIVGFNQFYENLSDWAGYSIIPSIYDYHNFAQFLEDKEKYNYVISFSRFAIEKFPYDSGFYYQIGYCMIKLGNKKEAKIHIEQALKILENEVFDPRVDKRLIEHLYFLELEKAMQ